MKSKGNKLVKVSSADVQLMSLSKLRNIIKGSLEKALGSVTNVTSDHRYAQGIYVVLEEIDNILADCT